MGDQRPRGHLAAQGATVRYGVLSDIHGNLPALEAALSTLDAHRPNAVLYAGDLVGYGAFPNECVALIASGSSISVAGNHDLVALGHQPDDLLDELGAMTIRWTRRVLNERSRGYLDSLRLQAEAGSIVMAHGSLTDPWKYVGPGAAAEEVARLGTHRPQASMLVLGHTHMPMAYCEGVGTLLTDARIELLPGRRYLLNPGAVGQSRGALPAARALLLDLSSGTATFFEVEYDVERYLDALRRFGLPESAHHLLPNSFGLPARKWFGRRRRPRPS